MSARLILLLRRSWLPALFLTCQLCLTLSVCTVVPALGQAVDDGDVQSTDAATQRDPHRPADPVSPVLDIRRQGDPPEANGPRPPASAGLRTIDGSGNNSQAPTMGSTGTPLLRILPVAYEDGISSLAGQQRPGPRTVSNLVSAQTTERPNRLGVTDYLWQWGQFLDHDLDLTDGVDPPEPADIAIPVGDPYFDPQGTGEVTLSVNRSLYDPESGLGEGNPRQQVNEITAWVDASNVYGSDEERAQALRTLDGTGRLRTSDGNLLPFNEDGLPNAGGPGAGLFLAGDVRANEQLALTAMHTLFVREHNRLARQIARRDPELSGDQIYQRARRTVGALLQSVTYNEFLPVLLGPGALPPYEGYQPDLDASISNAFATAAYRFGHSTLSTTILRLDRRGEEISAGHLPLRDAFFAPHRLADEGGIEPILRGLAAQICQAADPLVVDDLRNFLFGPPGSGGFDLVSLNIQRGRDHGLPSYNRARRALGLPPARGFADITTNPELRQRLRATYDNVGQVDLWVGGLAEDPLPGAMLGETFSVILIDQFTALRDGDRFWYERALSDRE
ncbi:MAG: peroxidase family protein, partial [Acidobacteriota bacterium]|nr:peroxidase family protein [Acidobacteriota bacterium]